MMNVPHAPRPTGAVGLPLSLTGKLFAWSASTEQPVFLSMPGSELHYLACFTREDSLRAIYARIGVAFDSIKRIDDGDEFILSILAPDVALIVDPWFTPEGRVRFLQVHAEERSR